MSDWVLATRGEFVLARYDELRAQGMSDDAAAAASSHDMEMKFGPAPPPKRTLVLASQDERRRHVAPEDVRVGWRITCQNGDLCDVMWGSVRREQVAALLLDLDAKHGPLKVVDLRGRPDDVRDKGYWQKRSQENGNA